jgi:hypothetical protein
LVFNVRRAIFLYKVCPPVSSVGGEGGGRVWVRDWGGGGGTWEEEMEEVEEVEAERARLMLGLEEARVIVWFRW